MVTSTAAMPSARRLQRLRRLVLARDPVCQWTECNQPETEVDHIVARRPGGGAVLDNLQGLCKFHHSLETTRDDGRWGLGGSNPPGRANFLPCPAGGALDLRLPAAGLPWPIEGPINEPFGGGAFDRRPQEGARTLSARGSWKGTTGPGRCAACRRTPPCPRPR